MRMRCAQVLVFTTISLVAVFGSALPTALYPFFPQEAALKGTSRGVVGLIYGLYALSQLFICPVLSKMVTHVPAKVLFIAGIALTGICTILFGLGGRISSQTLFILVCIITHSLSGIGAAASDIMAVIFINTTFPNITTMLGILEVFCSVGVLLGPPLGGALYERFQYEPPFLILGSLYLILIPFSMLTLPNQGESQEVQPGGYKRFLQRKSVLVMSLQVCISSVAMTFIRPIMPPFLTHQFSLLPSKIGLILLGFGCSYAVFAPLFGFISDAHPDSRWSMITFGTVLCSAAFTMMGPAPVFHIKSKLWLMITTLCFLGIFLAAMVIPAFSIILDGAFEAGLPDTVSTHGIVASHFNSMWYLGSFVGPIFGGILSEYMSFEWCTTLQGGILFVMAIILLASICSCKLRYTQPTEHASEEQNILSASTPQYKPTYDATGVHTPQ